MVASNALEVITEQLKEAIAAPKCRKCGCLQQTVEALATTEAGQGELAPVLAHARRIFVPRRYDCLSCAVCYPAIAANVFAEAYPEAGGSLDLCPTEEPEERRGWPPLPGDFSVIRYGAPVGVCTLNSASLAASLAASRPAGLAIVGTMQTENLGIERLIKNTIANPHIRFLLLCGKDTQRAVGHLPGQSLASLFSNGLDEGSRIIGANGKRPLLKNVSRAAVQAFLQQVELVPRLGETDPARVASEISAAAQRDPGPFPSPFVQPPVARVEVIEPKRLILDKAGYFVIYPDARAQRLVLEHYTNNGVLNCVLESKSTGALYGEVIERELLTRLDHAAYLGRELARAEQSLLDGTPFVQDAAPGELTTPARGTCCSGSSCRSTTAGQNGECR